MENDSIPIEVRRVVGANTRRWRRESLLSQPSLAALVGLTAQTIGNLERGQTTPCGQTVQILIDAGILDVEGQPNLVYATQVRRDEETRRAAKAATRRKKSPGAAPGHYTDCGLAAALEAWRDERNLSVSAMGQQLGCGIYSLQKWMDGSSLPSPKLLRMLITKGVVSHDLARKLVTDVYPFHPSLSMRVSLTSVGLE